VQLPNAEDHRLVSWCRSHGVTLNTAIQCAWALVLGAIRRIDDVVFGSVVSGRPPDLAGAEHMLGLFINTVPVRVRLSSDEPIVSWLKAFQRQHAWASERAYTPLATIARCSALRPQEELFDTIVNVQNYPAPEIGQVEWKTASDRDALYVSSNSYPLTVHVNPRPVTTISFLSQPHVPDGVVDEMASLLRVALSLLPSETHASTNELSYALHSRCRKRARLVRERRFKTLRRRATPAVQ
jgi:non-ribosomal peptide synthetase component F